MASDIIEPGSYARRETDVTVTYTIKEMFTQTTQAIGRIESLIAQMGSHLSDKASVEDLSALEGRVAHFERKEAGTDALVDEYRGKVKPMVESHETQLQRQDAVRANLKSTWALVFSAVASASALMTIMAYVRS